MNTDTHTDTHTEGEYYVKIKAEIGVMHKSSIIKVESVILGK
jgi:hypothetical protein